MQGVRKLLAGVLLNVLLCTASPLEQREPKDGDLKLVDGPSTTAGTLMVYRGYGWGFVCDDHWTMKEASVVCHQLGMGHALEAYRRNRYASPSRENYFMDEVRCTGKEERLIDCRFSGWAIHDCKQNEQAGVKCSELAPVVVRPAWNLLRLPLNRTTLAKMAQTKVAVVETRTQAVRRLIGDGQALVYPVAIRLPDSSIGSVCPDHFRSAEAIVFCRQIGQGIGGQVIPVSAAHVPSDYQTTTVIIGRCYGNETDLSNCLTYADAGGVPCTTSMSAAVECVAELPDLTPERHSMETSSYMQTMRLWLLECALEENCFPDSVYRLIDRNPGSHALMARNLMRFSSIIENHGTAAFRPYEDPSKWEWHACHMHYHSMKVFSRYTVIDNENRLVAVGHKASFCLEDNVCRPGVRAVFRCSNVIDTKGTQGISPGCQDMYLHDYDCQWVDITDIPPGEYTFQVAFNPDFLVPESDFFNNALSCVMTYYGHNAVVRRCHYIHLNDLL